ncbi:MAG: kinase [Steroidobacteraceae bacterium]
MSRGTSTMAEAYSPLLARIEAAAVSSAAPFVVGLSGPQGSGKSTLAQQWLQRMQTRGLSCAALSLDDFYLTRAQRRSLSERVHPLLAIRGVPGTHDVRLASETLNALRATRSVALPSFDKARDDRRPAAQWPRVAAPVQVVIFEGWCVGAVPQDELLLATPVNALEREHDADGRWRRYVNATLARDYQPLFRELDMLVLLKAPSFDVVFEWRREQELTRRQHDSGAAGVMTDEQLRWFIQHYERLTRHILEEMPARADVVIELDERRLPVPFPAQRR